ncbi:c-type cytochrome biogenesis protein CcsB [Thiomicrospira sp. ALE5]|uniref:c-type cytochrome biogenesis protein CcsB n=1 Tax=Thiomicrospira sp. ALE5 TaxID=748650 RepID=UPI0008E70D53|nr:c-type cytochrome biogenesis protein CcsB [Thiomicrospira sp. ALE5]SFR56607.1 cytochrome c-type biogenesis protein CcsB [Thiomicrospira sp. ALE5]
MDTTINQNTNRMPKKESIWDKILPRDYLWAAFIFTASFVSWLVYSEFMDVYEEAILFGTALATIWMGWYWRSFQTHFYTVTTITLMALWMYQLNGNEYAAQETNFFLKYLISSQAAIMWMTFFVLVSTITYFVAFFKNSDFIYRLSTFLAWTAATFGFVGMMVRWYESYLINVDYGHIPVSSLYEVFILFVVMTILMYLYYEQKFKTRAMGGFVMVVMSASVLFVLWYVFDRQAHEIQPLIPALQSWWMKIHVPANFVGYGGFSIAAMIGVAVLWRLSLEKRSPQHRLLTHMPSLQTMENIMYRSIAIGFAFFTLATVLGAMWAAEAWGGYWSWDPKETWSLILWLTYAGWLHMRMTKGWSGPVMAWWAVIGLFVTTFTFLGVNIFLSGLHSYGEL